MRIQLACAFAVLLLTAACSPGDHGQPNIIFIFTDDHATQAIGAYGGRLATLSPTPNIDRLASEGLLFRNAFVTNAICAPSRAVILTGMYSHLNSVPTNAERFDSSQVTFPRLLQGAGYQTAMVGKWHLKSDPVGFDYWEVLPGQGQYYNPQFRTAGGVVQDTGYVTDLITDKVIDWLESGRDKDRPFMVMYQHKAPHREWSPGPGYLTMYDDTEIPEPSTLFDDYSGRSSAALTQEMTIARHMNLVYDLKVWPPDPRMEEDMYTQWAQGLRDRMTEEQRTAWDAAYRPKNDAFRSANLEGDDLTRWKYQRYLKDYLRCIASVDENLGRLLDYLDESGLADNTVVVYSSDQGFFLGEHGWFDKRWMYEESLRMPLVVRWPGVTTPGTEDTHQVLNLDFAETFLDMAGVAAPANMQGRSLVPLLEGNEPSDWRTSIYYHYYEFPGWHSVQRHYGIRTDRYKLIYYYLIDEWELFDLEVDPDELHSVYDDGEYAGVVTELKAKLDSLRDYYKVPAEDPVPLPDEDP
jgi:arylsulfatase A-like enzyme